MRWLCKNVFRVSLSWQLPTLRHIIPRQQLHRLHQRSVRRREFTLKSTQVCTSPKCIRCTFDFLAGIYASSWIHCHRVAFAPNMFRHLEFGLRPRLFSCRRSLQSNVHRQQRMLQQIIHSHWCIFNKVVTSEYCTGCMSGNWPFRPGRYWERKIDSNML